MLHSIESKTLGPFAEPMTRAVQACVHCGFCLAACPTYSELGQEMDTPRGRIVLMKQCARRDFTPGRKPSPHIDAVSVAWRASRRAPVESSIAIAQPPSAHWPSLIFGGRALKNSGAGSLRKRIPFPGRFRWATRAASLFGRVKFIPRALRPMLEFAPRDSGLRGKPGPVCRRPKANGGPEWRF